MTVPVEEESDDGTIHANCLPHAMANHKHGLISALSALSLSPLSTSIPLPTHAHTHAHAFIAKQRSRRSRSCRMNRRRKTSPRKWPRPRVQTSRWPPWPISTRSSRVPFLSHKCVTLSLQPLSSRKERFTKERKRNRVYRASGVWLCAWYAQALLGLGSSSRQASAGAADLFLSHPAILFCSRPRPSQASTLNSSSTTLPLAISSRR